MISKWLLNSKTFAGCLFAFVFSLQCFCNTPYRYNGSAEYIGKHCRVLKDASKALDISAIKNSKDFEESRKDIPNLGFTSANIWVEFSVQNLTSNNHLILELDAPLVDEAVLYAADNNDTFSITSIGQNAPFDNRKYKHPTYLYDLNIEPGQVKTFFMKVKSYDQVELPLSITDPLEALSSAVTRQFYAGIYCGIMLIMIFYNLFVYFSVRDKSYLFYVLYILSVMLTQATFQGYTFKYLWPGFPGFETQSIQLLSIAVGFASVQFLRVFLQTKLWVPKLDRIFQFAFMLYLVATVLVLLGYYMISWILILCIVSPLSMYMLFIAIKIARMGYKPAKYFSIAWSFFLVGVFIYAMKDFAILPHNNFTVYTMPVGSAIETVLLSFALADKINTLKEENEMAQAKTLQLLKENEQIILNQNILLENKVKERTAELEQTNRNLKEAEAHIVNVEKMASLGQLTAGISHEINNPINFVVSNVEPLKRDIEDILNVLEKYDKVDSAMDIKAQLAEIAEFKKSLDVDYLVTEINLLLNGIDEGASRTAEIVRGLKNFSRLQALELSNANLHEAIDSTLAILNSNISYAHIKVIKNYGNIPYVECYLGKINQVIMNILNNAVQAIVSKKYTHGEGTVAISTALKGNDVEIRIRDNGIGIPKNNQGKVFEPFFTTKEVGAGTGLGLSIVYGIINSHNGSIEVVSEENEGAEFIITLPVKHERKV